LGAIRSKAKATLIERFRRGPQALFLPAAYESAKRMSYRAAGILGVVLGILLIPALLAGFIIIFRGLNLLRLSARSIQAGTDPETCKKYGHDMRDSIQGYPAGKMCRNCLVRKDRAMIAWTVAPSGIVAVPFPGTPYLVPFNAPLEKRKAKDGQPKFLAVDAAPAIPREIPIEIVGFGRP